MNACRLARRVALLGHLALPGVALVSEVSLATKVLPFPCQPFQPGVRLRAGGVVGVNAVATPVQCLGVGVRIDGKYWGACRIARRPGQRLTVLTRMFWVTKGRSRSEAAG
jgi:hypothetical protein